MRVVGAAVTHLPRPRSGAALLLAVALAIVPAAAANAETVDLTSQAVRDGASFLIATPAAAPTAVCLVDTGVDGNADTTAVVATMALSGSSSDQSPTRHGTLMAMFMGADRNGWGMVGLWPAVRIVSVRASLDGSDTFTAAGFINGVKRCEAVASTYDVKVIELALSSTDSLTDSEAAALGDAIAQARSGGVTVVAAAGNTGGSLGTPANFPGVLSVGAADPSGALCSFSASGATLLAAGCDLDGADPATGTPETGMQGTSQASAITAAAVDALESYRPDLGPDAVADLLSSTATSTPGGRLLNVAAAFRAVGLGSVVDRGAAAAPTTSAAAAPTVPTTTLPLPHTPTRMSRLPTPRLRVRVHRRHRGDTLTIVVTNRPHGSLMRLRIYLPRRGEFGRPTVQRSTSATRITLQVGAWTRIAARFVDPHGDRPPSRLTTIASSAVR